MKDFAMSHFFNFKVPHVSGMSGVHEIPVVQLSFPDAVDQENLHRRLPFRGGALRRRGRMRAGARQSFE